MNRQIRRLGTVLIVLFCLLLAQLSYLQVVEADKLSNAPGNTRNSIRNFSGPRGAIESAEGVVLAQSTPSGDKFKRQRQYPEGQLFGQITGFMSFNYGNEGIERTYDKDLSGRSEVFRGLNNLFNKSEHTGTVRLTVRKDLQQLAADSLGNRKGAVVALDPTTGAVLAMWSFPSYDPNPLAGHSPKDVKAARDALINSPDDAQKENPDKPMLSRAYRERYFPGSTFKVITASAALEKKPELATKTYPVLRSLDLPQTTKNLSNFGGESCGGQLPQILKVSCNTAFAQMGLDLGAEKLAAQANEFGFNQKLPIDLPFAATSVFPDSSAFDGNLPALAKSAIGQEDVSATPLEMAMVAGAVANHGVIMKPHVVGEIRDSEGAVLRPIVPQQWLNPLSTESASTLRDMMIQVVQSGTGTPVQVKGTQVAAKTGTAQTGNNTSHAWIIAFAPADAPKVAVAVIVENQPSVTSATGGRVAGPIAAKIIKAALGLP